jgi:hypothetical protein
LDEGHDSQCAPGAEGWAVGIFVEEDVDLLSCSCGPRACEMGRCVSFLFPRSM